jgi:hypothetical protein
MLIHDILRYGKGMPCVGRSLELLFLFAVYVEIFPYALDLANTHLDAMRCEISIKGNKKYADISGDS